MTVLLSPNAKQQFFTDGGAVAAGYLLYTYAANSTTPQATYTNRAGTVANANPIVLDARGEAIIYLTPGVVYDYVLKTAGGVTVWTREDVSAQAGDADSVLFTQAGVGAVERTSQDKMREQISVKDFGAVGDGTTDDTAAIQAAITAVAGTSAGALDFPDGTYLVSSTLTVASGKSITLRAKARACARITKSTAGDILQAGDTKVEGLVFLPTGATGSCVLSTGDGLQLIGCGFVPGSSNTSALVVAKHANTNLESCTWVTSNASQFCVDVVSDTGNLCINGAVRGGTMYGTGNGVRFRTGTGGRPEGWSVDSKIICTGNASVELIDCFDVHITGVLDQSSGYGLKLSAASAGRVESVRIVDAYVATATAATTGKGVASSNAVVGGVLDLTVSRCRFQSCGSGVVLDGTMNGVKVSHCSMKSITNVSVNYTGAQNVSIDHNTLRGTNTLLSLIDGASGSAVSVIGNVIDTAGTVTYTPTSSANFEFSANVGKKLSGLCGVTVTANAGTSAAFTIPHGLAVTPDINKITGGIAQVTGQHEAPTFKISTVTATNITGGVYFTVTTPGTLRLTLSASG